MNIAIIHYGVVRNDINLIAINNKRVYDDFLVDFPIETKIDNFIITDTNSYHEELTDIFNPVNNLYLNRNNVKIETIINYIRNEKEEFMCKYDLNDHIFSIFPNIIHKWYKFQIGMNMCDEYSKIHNIEYDCIIAKRLDGKMMFKFDISQLFNINENEIYVQGPHWWRFSKELDCSLNDDYIETLFITKDMFFGDDWFFGNSKTMRKISKLVDNVIELHSNNKMRNLHAETIFQDYVSYSNLVVKLIKWSPFLNINDFKLNISITDTNKSFAPNINVNLELPRT